MSLSKTEFTNAGKTMLGRAQNTETLNISKIVVGSGAATQPSDLWPLTALIAHEMDVVISTQTDLGGGTLLVEGSLRSDQAPHAFYLKELGVLAHIGAEADQLYCVANVFTDPPDYIDPAAPTIQVFKIKLIIDRIPTGQLNVSIGPSENVVGSNIGAGTVGPGVYHDAAGNVLNFKRLVEGTAMDIHDSVDGNSIYIGVATLQNNLDLYVPATYPSPPPGALFFPSVQAAHDYLLGFVIPPDKFATIHIGPNILTTTAAIIFTHPNSSQINIIGMPRVDKTFTSLSFVDNTHKSVIVTPNNTGLSVGQYVYLAGTTAYWIGGCIISAISGNTITLTAPQRDTQAEVVGGDSGSGRRLSYFPSVLINSDATAYNTTEAVLGFPNGIGQIENLCCVGQGYIVQLASGNIKNCQIIGLNTGAKRGISSFTGLVALIGENVVTNCDFGITGVSPIIALDNTLINSCGIGIGAPGAGFGFGALIGNVPTALVEIAHCTYGIVADTGGNFQGGSIYFVCCDYGMMASNHSVLKIGQAEYQRRPGVDLYALG
jgi:hypothetical protein